MAPSAIEQPSAAVPDGKVYPPAKIFTVRETRFEKYVPPREDGRERALARSDTPAIVIDNGSSCVRAGWSFEKDPAISIPPIMAKFRDRKLGKTFSFAGNDCFADTTARGHIRNAFELGTGVVSNWDVMEHVLDHVFLKMGMNSANGSVDVPIVMTEAVANLPYSRKSMTEIIFECYGAPSLAYGIDSLFSYKHNQGKTGLVISSSHTSTHVIPVYNSKAMLPQAIRLNWGGHHGAEYLLKLIRLKYPTFSGKMNPSQAEHMLKDHSYLSQDYDSELASYLEGTGLEDRDIVIQYPFTEEVIIQKSEEELAKIAERKKESGRRLQEQAAKMRLDRLIKKEQDLEYYRQFAVKLETQNKKETRRLLDSHELKHEAELEKIIKELDKAVRAARIKDVGGDPEEEQEAPDFSLLEVPDEDLDEAQIKQKRLQRLMKANHEARARAKAEKEVEKARIAEEERLDKDRRENDLDSWLDEKRQGRAEVLQKMKERDRLNKDLGNRKSLASQIRMKSIANLASDNPTKKRRRGGGDDDNFGANDDDWGVYRQIAVGDNSDDEQEEEDLQSTLKTLEQELLQYDTNFTYENTHEAQSDWSKSLLHAFARGPRPFDPSSQAELNQIHLNIERIRVPEVVFRPSIAGVDQTGLIDIAGDILNQRLPGLLNSGIGSGSGGRGASDRDDFLRDIFLTGGNTVFQNFDERVRAGLRSLLPVDAPLQVRKARDPIGDAWRGAAEWAGSEAWKEAKVTREEYQEKGPEYIKEHDMGNSYA